MTDKTLFGAIFQFLLSYGEDCITSQRSALHAEKSVPQKGQIAIKGPSTEKKQGSARRTSAMCLSYWILCTCKAKINDTNKMNIWSCSLQSADHPIGLFRLTALYAVVSGTTIYLSFRMTLSSSKSARYFWNSESSRKKSYSALVLNSAINIGINDFQTFLTVSCAIR